MLVVLTGLPCTGTSAIAEAVARELSGALLSADPIDAALISSGIALDEWPDIAGYEVMKALAREQLSIGLSAVVDAVNPFDIVRQAYAEIAAEESARVSVIVTLCSDVGVHQQRVEQRHASGAKSIDWDGVRRQIAYYEPFTGDCLVLDAMDRADENVAKAIGYVCERRDS